MDLRTPPEKFEDDEYMADTERRFNVVFWLMLALVGEFVVAVVLLIWLVS